MWWVMLGYIVCGALKLKFFDRNGDGDWLMMLSDERSRKCHGIWVYVLLFLCWLTWPVGIISKKVSLARSFFHLQWYGL